jgi:probable F420-dependent oxidoreductase
MRSVLGLGQRPEDSEIWMRIRITFPQYELGEGRDHVIQDVRAAEESGFDHLSIYDHVLAADVRTRPEWQGPYTVEHVFHEPLVLAGFLSAVTNRIEFATSVLVLPQRQAALVAKQAAEVDLLSNRRLRLGVGIGWNAVEYEALGEDFHARGARLEEQIDVLRQLWTQQAVTLTGKFHSIDRAGISPLPASRPIPLWLGGGRGARTRVLERIGRLGDGWMSNLVPSRDSSVIQQAVDTVRAAAARSGRDPNTFEIDGLVEAAPGIDLSQIAADISAWKDLGATRITIRTLDCGLDFAGHLEIVKRLGAAYRS